MSRFSVPISQQIWEMKYQHKDLDGTVHDLTVEDTWDRIANALAVPEKPETRKRHIKDFRWALEDFKFLPAGRIIAGAGTERNVTLFNCFVMGTIPDSMDGIFSHLKEAALTMQSGGGIGYDFSTLRPAGMAVKGVGADASGPLTFMDVWDSMCRTVMSAGSRRGAMMATMRCDHPDIEAFIDAKADPDRLRMFNLSVLITDDFMKAVKADDDWLLWFDDRHGNRAVENTVSARYLWDKIMRATYAHAEPGVIFIDRVNQKNNLRYMENIVASNPCGEQMLPPYGACLLGSINLAQFIKNPFTEKAHVDKLKLDSVVQIAVRMLDNVIDVSKFPLPAQEREAKSKRRIGLGVTGLADALAMLTIRYGSGAAVRMTGDIMANIEEVAYEASIDLAIERGPFDKYDFGEYMSVGTHASGLPEHVRNRIEEHGIRNALVSSIAPTGTISLYAGNVSSGIEPIFATEYTRKVLQPDGSKTEERVVDYAVALWEKLNPGQPLPDYFVTAQTLTPDDHLRMMAAAQEYVDNSISKTINCPEDISFEDFKAIYESAHSMGCKGCTTYRPNEVTGSVLSVDKSVEEAAPVLPSDPPPQRPEKLLGATYKIKVGDQKAVYMTINDIIESDGTIRAFEIFLRSSDPTHDEWMVALARMVSAILRRPHDSRFVGPELMRIASPVSGGFQHGKGYQPSLVGAIGAAIKDHMDGLSGDGPVEVEANAHEWGPEAAEAHYSVKAKLTFCPKCNSTNTKNENGCLTCLDCGHSKCG